MLYNISIEAFMLQIVSIIECSETKTHLLPRTLSSLVSSPACSTGSRDSYLDTLVEEQLEIGNL